MQPSRPVRRRRRRGGTGARAPSGDLGSPASIGCVVDKVSARSSRAATIGSTVICERCASNMPTSASLSVIGRRVISWKRVPTLDTRRQMSITRCWMITTAAASASSKARPGGMAESAASSGSGSSAASITAAMTSSLSAKARKMVPSAIPAASAIWRLVTRSPCSISSGSVAATIIERRSSGGSAVARFVRISVVGSRSRGRSQPPTVAE